MTTPITSPFDLPQELQDIIFNLAYPADAEGSARFYRTKADWHNRELFHRKCHAGYQRRPFPALKVESFLVSKRWFVIAAQTWARNQVFEVSKQGVAFTDLYGGHRNGIVPAFAKDVVVDITRFRDLQTLPSLRRLTLVVESWTFEKALEGERFAWRVLLEKEELVKVLGGLEGFEKIAGGVKVRFVAQRWGFAREQQEVAIWEANVAALVEVFFERRGSNGWRMKGLGLWTGILGGGDSLYHGSKIYWESAQQRRVRRMKYMMKMLPVVVLVIGLLAHSMLACYHA